MYTIFRAKFEDTATIAVSHNPYFVRPRKTKEREMVSTLFELNNEGILWLQQGCHDEAGSIFQRALMRLRAILYSKIDASAFGEDDDQDMEEVNSQSAKASVCVCVGGQKRGNQECTENQFSLYDSAFVLPGRGVERQIFASADIENLTSATLLYNLGLCYHKRAMANGKSRDLKQALSLYQKAASLAEYFDEAAEHSVLLVLALFNNMGHIHAEHFETSEATRCMDSMEMVLDSHECQEFLDEEEYYFFSWHFFVFPDRPVWIAPAA